MTAAVDAPLLLESRGRLPALPLPLCALAIATISMLVPIVSAETIDPDNDDSQHAWTENTGWINAEPRGDGGPGMHIAAGWIKGWLWSENLGWISLSCDNTASCGTVDYQVRHGRDGEVSGFAWSENAGWISFSCENTGSCSAVDYSVTIDLRTGELTGFAWSENVGWISLSCSNSSSCDTVDFGVNTIVPFPDHLFVDGFESGNTVVWSTSLR